MTLLNQITQEEQAARHLEEQLDKGLEESFPASDPLAIQTDRPAEAPAERHSSKTSVPR